MHASDSSISEKTNAAFVQAVMKIKRCLGTGVEYTHYEVKKMFK